MTHRAIRHPEARSDIIELADYLSHRSLTVAMRFLDAVEDTIQFLLQNREAGQRCNFASAMAEGVRVWPVNHFRNHLVFYRPTADGIEIVRVLHGARDIESMFGQGPEP